MAISTTTTRTAGNAATATSANNNNNTSSSTLLRNRHKVIISSSTSKEINGGQQQHHHNNNRRRVRGAGGNNSSILPMYVTNSSPFHYYSNSGNKNKKATTIFIMILIVGSSIAMICGLFRYHHYDTLKYYQSKTKSSMKETATEFTAADASGGAGNVNKATTNDDEDHPKIISRMMMISKEEEQQQQDKQQQRQRHNQQERKPPIIHSEKRKKKVVEVYPPGKKDKEGQQQQQQQYMIKPKEYNNNPILPTNNIDGIIYDIAILGAGPAGLSAAIFGARAGLSVIVLGSQSGLLSETTMLNNFPSYIDFENHGNDGNGIPNTATSETTAATSGGPKWLQTTKQQALSFGANFAPPGLLALDIIQKPSKESTTASNTTENTNNVFVLPTNQQQQSKSDSYYQAYSIIIATGANPRRLNLPNEDKLWSKQIHNCAICDGNIYEDKTVLVVGGGDAAIDAALLLARYAKSVKLVHRSTTFPKVKNQLSINLIHESSNIQIVTPYVVDEWKTETTKTAATSSSSSLVLTGAKLKRVDTNNNENGSSNENSKCITVDCDGAFLMIGATPNTEWLSSSSSSQQRGNIELDEEGFIKLQQSSSSSSSSSSTMATSLDGIFAAGEVTDKIYRQAITASSQGAQAGMDAERWLRQNKPRNNIDFLSNKGVTAKASQLAAGASAAVEKQDNDGGVERIEVPVKNDEKVGTGRTDGGEENCDDLTQQDCITKLVQSHPVVVFSKPWCPFCRKALETLSLASVVDPYVVDLSKYGRTTSDIQATLQQMTGRRTVPNVFVNGKSIGGGDETVALHRDGKLIPLLREAGAISTTTTEEGKNDSKHDMELDKKGNEIQRMEKTRDESGNNNDDGLCDLTTKDCMIQLTKKYPVLLFTLRGCPECTQMYELLDLLKLEIQPFKIDLRDQSREAYANMRQSLREMAGSQSVPSLFVGGESLGGFRKTSKLHQQGLLVPKFKQVGAIKDTKQDNDADKLCDLATKECILQLTKQHPVLLFTLRGCPECTQMFELLDTLNLEIPPYKIDLKDHPGEPYMNMRMSLLEMAGSQSVPSLFVGGESLGGFEKTNKLNQQGLLIPKFVNVGAIKE